MILIAGFIGTITLLSKVIMGYGLVEGINYLKSENSYKDKSTIENFQDSTKTNRLERSIRLEDCDSTYYMSK